MNSRERLAVFGIVLAGTSLGFLTGLLTAPRSGRKTRERLARRLEDEKLELARRSRRAIQDAGDAIGERLEDGKRVIEDGKRAVARSING